MPRYERWQMETIHDAPPRDRTIGDCASKWAPINLLYHNFSFHPCAPVRLAIVIVLACFFELYFYGLSRSVQIILLRNCFGVHSRWDRIFVKDNIMGEPHVVYELDRLASLYRDRVWNELE